MLPPGLVLVLALALVALTLLTPLSSRTMGNDGSKLLPILPCPRVGVNVVGVSILSMLLVADCDSPLVLILLTMVLLPAVAMLGPLTVLATLLVIVPPTTVTPPFLLLFPKYRSKARREEEVVLVRDVVLLQDLTEEDVVVVVTTDDDDVVPTDTTDPVVSMVCNVATDVDNIVPLSSILSSLSLLLSLPSSVGVVLVVLVFIVSCALRLLAANNDFMFMPPLPLLPLLMPLVLVDLTFSLVPRGVDITCPFWGAPTPPAAAAAAMVLLLLLLLLLEEEEDPCFCE